MDLTKIIQLHIYSIYSLQHLQYKILIAATLKCVCDILSRISSTWKQFPSIIMPPAAIKSVIWLRHIYCSTYFPAFITHTVISSGFMNASSFWVHAHWLSTGWCKHYWLLAVKTVIFIMTKYTCVRHLSLTKPLLKAKVNEAEDLWETLWLWMVWCCRLGHHNQLTKLFTRSHCSGWLLWF